MLPVLAGTDKEVVESDLFLSMDSISVNLWGEASDKDIISSTS